MADEETQVAEMNGQARTDEDDFDAPPPEEIFDEVEPEIEVKIRAADKVIRSYFVRQFELATKTTNGGLATWMKILGKRIKTDSDGKITHQDYNGFHEDLIALCLYDAASNRVSKDTITRWSPRIKNHLFEKCQAINGLSTKARTAAGKA